ncbi:MAG: hypothetical protein EA427_10680 [Spirochaetaceae bacterium]|nr:MAG: hypothetical protein EA427_10680 [Spirochaetaceae bacterium]
MATMKEIRARLRVLGLENEFGYRREIKRLPECLERDETLIAITSGIREGARWYILLTEHRLLLLSKPTMADPRLVGIKREEIRHTEHRKGFFLASLRIDTIGGSYTFTNVLKKSLPSFLSALRKE